MTRTLYIDADACPVKQEALRVAARRNWRVVMVSNGGIRPSREANVQIVVVSGGFDAADDWIADTIGASDVAVTADIPLAARCLAKGARALAHNGNAFTPGTIGTALAMRELSAHLRETGESKGYHAPFSGRDRSRFLETLNHLMEAAERALT